MPRKKPEESEKIEEKGETKIKEHKESKEEKKQ